MAEPSHGFRKFMLDPKTSVMTYIADNIPSDRIYHAQGGNAVAHTQSQPNHPQQSNDPDSQQFQAQGQSSQGQTFLEPSNGPLNLGHTQPFQSSNVQPNSLTTHSQIASNQPFTTPDGRPSYTLSYAHNPGQSVQSSYSSPAPTQPAYGTENILGNYLPNSQQQDPRYDVPQPDAVGSLPYPHSIPQQWSSQWEKYPEPQEGPAYIQGVEQLAIPSPSRFRAAAAEMLGQGPPPPGTRRKGSAHSSTRTYHRMVLDYEGTRISFYSARSQNRFQEMSSMAYELESLSRRIWALRRDHAEEFEDFSNVGHASIISAWQARYELWADTVLDLQEGQIEPNKSLSWPQNGGSSNHGPTQWDFQSNRAPDEREEPPTEFVPTGSGLGKQQPYDSNLANQSSGQNGPQLKIRQNPAPGQENPGQRIQAGTPSQIDRAGRADYSNSYFRNESMAPNNASTNSDAPQRRQTPQLGTLAPRNDPPGMAPQTGSRQNVPPNQRSPPGPNPDPNPNPNTQSRPNTRPGTPSSQNVVPRQGGLPSQQAPIGTNPPPPRTQQNPRPGNSPNFPSNVQKGGPGQPIRQ